MSCSFWTLCVCFTVIVYCFVQKYMVWKRLLKNIFMHTCRNKFYHIMQPSLMTLFIQIRPKYQNIYKTPQILMAHLLCSIPYCNYCASLFTKV